MKEWVSKKKVIRIVIELIIIACVFFIHINYKVVPSLSSVNIKTLDINNPTVKLVTFKNIALNRSKKAVDFKVCFTKKEDAAKWYPYYDIIPANYVTEMYHIEPEESKGISSEIVVETDDMRLITSWFNDVDIKYEVIK